MAQAVAIRTALEIRIKRTAEVVELQLKQESGWAVLERRLDVREKVRGHHHLER